MEIGSSDIDLISQINSLRAKNDFLLAKEKKFLGYLAWANNVLNQIFSNSVQEKIIVQKISQSFYRSNAQNFQDLIVEYLYPEGYKGVFCEIGACDGEFLSNTLLLEKELGWVGLLVEPNPYWHEKLKVNRGALIDYRPVSGKTNETIFFAPTNEPEYSTSIDYLESDQLASKRVTNNTLNLKSVSLNDLFYTHSLPYSIDFMSIDTEGGEFEILSGFDFGKYSINLLVVEHNYSINQSTINRLLISKGYIQILDSISLWDSWWVNPEKFNFEKFKFSS